MLNIDNFVDSLEIMGKGMFGIFTVIIIITLLVILIQKIDRNFEEKK